MSATPTTPANRDEITRAINLICEPEIEYELRVLNANGAGTVSGRFDNREMLAAACAQWSGQAPAVYVLLNPRSTNPIDKTPNGVVKHAKTTTKDHEIARRRRLLFDFDAVRPDKKTSSTNAEHAATLEVARRARDWLRECGWPEPLLGDSGNGHHLVFAINLPNDAAARSVVQACLKAMSARFSTTAVNVDTSVGNAARISKVYGTMACKGPNTLDRPHRFARIVEAPAILEAVPVELLEALAEVSAAPPPPPRTPAKTTSTPFDVDRYLHEHRVGVKRDEPYECEDGPGHRWILNECPFDPDHGKGSDTAILQLASGAPVFKCQHDGCADVKWKDFREAVEDRPLDEDEAYPEPAGPRDAPDGGDEPPNAPAVIVRVEDADWMRPEPLDAFMERDLRRGTPLVAPWLYPQDTVVIGAFRGTGKSYFGLEMFIALTSGTPAFGAWPVAEPRSVALYDLENPGYITKERLRLLRAGRPAKAEAMLYSTDARGRNIELSDPIQQDRFLDVCQRQEVVIVDNISAGYHAGPENDAQTWVALSDLMLKLRCAGKTAIFMYQSGKSKETTRGSSRLEDVVSIVLMLQSPPGWDQDQGLKVTTRFTKARGVFGADTPRVTISLKTTPWSANWEVVRTTAETEEMVEAAMTDLKAQGLATTNAAVAERTHLSKRTVAGYAMRIRARWKTNAAATQGRLDDLDK